MKKILAVSGGIDSMVMLDLLAKEERGKIVVAHFNHGTRVSSDLDMEFVKKRCEDYGILFVSKKIMLGEGVSEEVARQERYDYLYHVANKFQGKICTAHHLDDLLESIVINLIRGTGWRGLTPLGNSEIERPLLNLGYSKLETLQYAAENKIVFRQDPTNNSDDYLRNRVRRSIMNIDRSIKQEIIRLYVEQKLLRNEIEKIISEVSEKLAQKNSHGEIKIRKDFFKTNEKAVAIEILKYVLQQKKLSLTRPQLNDLLAAIKNYATNKKFNLPRDKMAVIGRDFVSL